MEVDFVSVDTRGIQLVQDHVDVAVVHVPLWSVEGIGWGCIMEEELWRTERHSRSMARCC